ncbi:MAG: L-glutamate gamma-semialdehyde dehydrogenase [Candidatus Coatesbacteria bacterium]|nr:MAG: L-glutamate gamma-semialdehyde dehydrogenase [Candidatus Coatesbacteria bacterium]
MLPEFKNFCLADFSISENRKKMEDAIKQVEEELGKEYPIIIGGEKIETEKKIESINPSVKKEVVGRVSRANRELAERAIKTAYEKFQEWRFTSPDERARYLLKAAEIMRQEVFYLSALMVVEEGKNWIEAYADTAEAIDFLEFYAREMMRYGKEQPVVPYPGEENSLFYIPLGVVAVIPPWNFPCAILVGMTSAAIVTGNTVVLKPASSSPVIGYKFAEIMERVGLPDGVLNFLPGSGAEVGDTIVGHPLTRMVAFTGSRDVGLHINELAAKTQPGQRWIKRVIAEMGGKDTIIVDETADLDSAVNGIVASAYGFQGQKCSACSRLIIVKDVYDELLDRIIERVKEIKVGDVRDYDNYMGPVINEQAFNKIKEYIEIGKGEGRLMTGGGCDDSVGYFIEPTIIGDVDPMARISQEEIFGPVLAVIKAKDFDEALEIANNTEYGLTGGVYSTNRANLERARREFFVGNLYFNRKITGALVGVQPFGGFNMSGTDSKAGGSDYLLLFMQAKSVAERF